MKKLPEFLKQYFWDVDFDILSLEKSRTFILKRVLDRGDTTALSWLMDNFTKAEIKNLLQISRDISAKTGKFWADYLELDPKKVLCLQKPYSRIQFGLSS